MLLKKIQSLQEYFWTKTNKKKLTKSELFKIHSINLKPEDIVKKKIKPNLILSLPLSQFLFPIANEIPRFSDGKQQAANFTRGFLLLFSIEKVMGLLLFWQHLSFATVQEERDLSHHYQDSEFDLYFFMI